MPCSVAINSGRVNYTGLAFAAKAALDSVHPTAKGSTDNAFWWVSYVGTTYGDKYGMIVLRLVCERIKTVVARDTFRDHGYRDEIAKAIAKHRLTMAAK